MKCKLYECFLGILMKSLQKISPSVLKNGERMFYLVYTAVISATYAS